MNIAIILAAGVGQRMRNGGLPKQFLKLMGKPIVIYTLEKFQECSQIDRIIVVCHNSWVDYMEKLVKQYSVDKVSAIVVGGADRQASIRNGLKILQKQEPACGQEDIVVIHDGVRPLVEESTIEENIRIAKQYGNAMTVKQVTESVVVTREEKVSFGDFKKREDTYSLTSPQTFRLEELLQVFDRMEELQENSEMPLLDAALVYAKLGKEIQLVKEQGMNLKITTPEDYYCLKAILEMEENKFIFGL